jgi:hypothetical protein
MRRVLLPLGLAVGVLAGGPADGRQAGSGLALPGGVEVAGQATGASAPATLFPVTPEAGEWMICAAHYSGPDAPELARQVVLDLRDTHGLPAYVFNHAARERGKQEEEYRKLQERYPGVKLPRRYVRVQEECAVLVGGFKDFDAATGGLKKVKELPLPKLNLGEGKTPYEIITIYEPDPKRRGLVPKRAPLNPYTNAMVVRNPTVPAPARPVAKFDPAWKQFNEGEEYSLLKCRKRYTLVVKEYQGAAIVPSQGATNNFLKMVGLGKGETLSAIGEQAHKLAEFLRDPRLGFTAYVLHTRTASIVTVGEFDSLDDPELQRLQRQIASLKFSGDRSGTGADPVGLMHNPVPMEVPHE